MATIEEDVHAANLQGISLAQQGRLEEAAEWFRHALQLKPDSPAANNNLGNILALQGRFREAVPYYRAALELQQDAPTWNNLCNALRQLGELDEAVACGRRALAINPHYPEAHSNLGIALQAQNQLDEAVEHCRQAVHLQPNFPEAHNNLGLVLKELGRHEEAAAACRRAIELRPHFPEAYNHLGLALLAQDQAEQAAECFHQALRIRPDLVEAHVNLGTCLERMDRLDEAAAKCEDALRLRPDFAGAYSSLGAIRLRQARYDAAVSCFDEAIRLEPRMAKAHFNRGQTLLLLGNYTEGWKEYEWRWKCTDFAIRPFRRPFWDGSPLTGKSILLHAEQGLGDTLQFIRYAALVKKQAETVVVACQAPLIPLLSRCTAIDRLVPQAADYPECDTHAPLLNLPSLFGTTLDTIPRDIPYLSADEALVDHWRQELAGLHGVRVGIAWQGRPKHPLDRQRSIPLAEFAPLAQGGIHLISLQKGPGSEQLDALRGRFAVLDLGRRLDDATGAFMDTAAVLTNLDLVVTADTAVAHLAGALGVPVWLALSFLPDWRWLLDREDTPWYPTMRLFRQRVPGKWDEVFARMASELHKTASRSPRPASVSIEISPGELVDKITILEIKRERLDDAVKRANADTELRLLSAARDRALPPSGDVDALTAELRQVNADLWDVEEELRACEKRSEFGPRFIELARSVYRHNDRRAVLKRRINELLGSKLIEEKSYA